MAFLSPPPPPPPPPTGFQPAQPMAVGPPVFTVRRKKAALAFSFPKNPFNSKSRLLTIANIEVYDKKALPNLVIDEIFNPLRYKQIPLSQLDAAVAALNKWYKDNDYLASRVVLVHAPGLLSKTAVLRCLEPTLSDIRLEPVDKDGKPDPDGDIYTRKGTILNALGLKPGDVFAWRPVGFARLMALGVFEYVAADVRLVSVQKVELILKLRERRTGRLEPGAGVSSDGRMFGDVSIIHNNFMGRAQRLRVEWQKQVDNPRSSGGIAFEDMRVGARIPISVRMRAYRDSNASRSVPVSRHAPPERSGVDVDVTSESTPLRYEQDRDGVLVDLGYRLSAKNLMFNLTPMLENVHSPTLGTTNGILQLVLQSSCTHVTRLPNDTPRGGHLVRLEQNVGKRLRRAGEPFGKTVLRLSQYFAFGTKSSIAAGLTFSVGSGNLPWHEQRALGGHSSVRGYAYGELGRYITYGTGRIEIRVPLTFANGTESTEAAAAKFATKAEQAKEAAEKEQRTREDASKSKTKGERERRGGTAREAESAKKAGDAQVAEGSHGEADGDEGDGTMGVLSKLPPLVGVLFGDAAVADSGEREILGGCYGFGLRVGGIVSIEWTTQANSGKSGVHFGLIDRNL